jgi:hypothetical protein
MREEGNFFLVGEREKERKELEKNKRRIGQFSSFQ